MEQWEANENLLLAVRRQQNELSQQYTRGRAALAKLTTGEARTRACLVMLDDVKRSNPGLFDFDSVAMAPVVARLLGGE